jgi:hypothetical protein
MATRTELLIIDPQIDFCDPAGALYVPGAEHDMGRLAAMVRRLEGELADIHVTLDSHHPIHIAHPIFWKDAKGEHPAPFTTIAAADVADGRWTTSQPGMYRRALEYVRWSLYPMGGSAVRLPRQIPYTVAAELLLTGRTLLAPEAKELGLIGHVVPDGTALAKAHELADMIAANGPLAVQAILRTMRESEGKHEEEAWADDAKVGAAVFASEDAKEGPKAFLEKRKPEFKGR